MMFYGNTNVAPWIVKGVGASLSKDENNVDEGESESRRKTEGDFWFWLGLDLGLGSNCHVEMCRVSFFHTLTLPYPTHFVP
jgi:hypothetical protein